LSAPSDKPHIEYFDAEVPGLTLRITSDRVKTWSLVYRHRVRKRRLTLGRYPDTGSPRRGCVPPKNEAALPAAPILRANLDGTLAPGAPDELARRLRAE
jgi:hypothetical protein